jgi:hypothetical protein
MATQLLTEKYTESLDGVLGCNDRIVITGTIEYIRKKTFRKEDRIQNLRVSGRCVWPRGELRTGQSVRQPVGLRLAAPEAG